MLNPPCHILKKKKNRERLTRIMLTTSLILNSIAYHRKQVSLERQTSSVCHIE
jgi:hypothetical protein